MIKTGYVSYLQEVLEFYLSGTNKMVMFFFLIRFGDIKSEVIKK